MANMLLMQTEEVRSLANQTINSLDDLESRVSNVAGEVANLDWVAPGRNSYVHEFQQTAQTIRRLLEEGRELCRRASQESQRWEEMAGGVSSGVSSATRQAAAIYGDTFLSSMSDVYDWAGLGIVSTAAFFSRKEIRDGLRAIQGSKGEKIFLMGLKPGTTVMGQAKFFKHIDDFVEPLGVLAFGMDALNDAYRYRDQGAGMIASSVAVNAFVVGLGMGAAAIIGTASAPAVIAGAAVGIGLGLAMDMKVGPNGQPLEDICVKGLHDIGESTVDNAPEFFENISDGVSKLSSWVRDPIASTSGAN